MLLGCWGSSSSSTTGSVSQLRAAWPSVVIRSCFVPCLLSKLNESRCVTAVIVVTVMAVTMVTAVNVGTVTVVTMATSVTVITMATFILVTVTMATAVTVVTVVLWYCGGRAPP